MVAQTLAAEDELWLALETSKCFCYLVVHQLVACLGPEKVHVLPMLHALTGCDTVSAFAVHIKKMAWTTWNSLPELADALLTLACAPTGMSQDTTDIIERFFLLMYIQTSTSTEVTRSERRFVQR